MIIRKYDRVMLDTSHKEQMGGVHPIHELLYISTGEMTLYSDGDCYEINAQSLFLISPFTPHTLVNHSKKCSYWYIELDLSDGDLFPSNQNRIAWNSLQGNINEDSPYYSVIFRTLELLTELMELCPASEEQAALYEECLKLDVQKTLLLINRFLAENKGRRKPACPINDSFNQHANQYAVTDVMRFLECSYMHTIRLSTLSEIVHLNASYIIRLFKQQTGITPFQYLQELRIHAALHFLIESEMSIQEIADTVGYNSIHYFSRMFKIKIGKSPKQWRQEQLNLNK